MNESKNNLPANLVIQLREPFQGTLSNLRVRCLAPRPPDVPWTSPFMRMRQALTRGEKLELHVSRDVQLQKWDPGNFRLLSSKTSSDGGQILTLEDPRTIDARGTIPPSRRPSLIGKSQGIDVHTAQQTSVASGRKEWT